MIRQSCVSSSNSWVCDKPGAGAAEFAGRAQVVLTMTTWTSNSRCSGTLGREHLFDPASVSKGRRRQHRPGQADETLDRIRQSKRRLWPIITRELEAFGLPEDLGYLAWLESEMDPSAESPTGSIGLWQFERETARAYGLRVDAAVDERADPVKSSHAAAQMLADLFAEFGGDATPIAVVAYNLGEPKMRALLRIAMERAAGEAGNAPIGTSIWLRRLPQEAPGLPPQFVAAAPLTARFLDPHRSGNVPRPCAVAR